MARVDSSTGIAYALNVGETVVTVEDIRVGHTQMSTLNVVLPETLYMHISTSDDVQGLTNSSMTRYIFPGNSYRVEIKVFSRGPDAHEIYITEVCFGF